MGTRRACLLLIGATLLAGCGDDEGDDAGSGPATGEDTEQRAVQQDAVAKGDARALATVIESCFVDQQDYSLCKEPAGAESGVASVETASAAGYTVVARSASGNDFRLVRAPDGAMRRECTERGEGGCPANGRW